MITLGDYGPRVRTLRKLGLGLLNQRKNLAVYGTAGTGAGTDAAAGEATYEGH